METKFVKPTLAAFAKIGGENIGISSADGRIKLSTLNGTLSVSAPSPASAPSPWRSVDTRRFRRVLDAAPEILLTDTGDRLVWQAGRATVALPTDAAEPPTVPPPDGPGVTVDAGEHARALDYLLPAVSDDDTRPNLHYIAAYRMGAWEATDGHRLHRVHTRANLFGEHPAPTSGESPLLLPAEQLAACLTMLRRAEGEVTYHVKPLDPAKPGWPIPKNMLRWSLPGDVQVTLAWEDPRVTFPHTAPLWSGVLGRSVRETEAGPLIDALSQGAKLVGTKKPLATLSVESSRLRLRVGEAVLVRDAEGERRSAISSDGLEYETALEITGERGEATFADRYAFNANYMAEALTLAKGDERGSDYARIALPKETTAPIHVSRGSYEALVMPVRA